MEPIFLEAVCKDYIWGGNQLRERFGKKSTADRIAESWELACHKDGSSRILSLWDQSIPGNPPEGYVIGTEYTKEEINKALALGEIQGRRLVPSRDYTGHGTAVLGIAAGNGRASEGANRGIAYESDLLVVKMKNADKNSFPRTTELMEGVDYLIRQSIRLGKPIVVNISFGNNYGSHEPYN